MSRIKDAVILLAEQQAYLLDLLSNPGAIQEYIDELAKENAQDYPDITTGEAREQG